MARAAARQAVEQQRVVGEQHYHQPKPTGVMTCAFLRSSEVSFFFVLHVACARAMRSHRGARCSATMQKPRTAARRRAAVWAGVAKAGEGAPALREVTAAVVLDDLATLGHVVLELVAHLMVAPNVSEPLYAAQ